jgi:hypothetical protein
MVINGFTFLRDILWALFHGQNIDFKLVTLDMVYSSFNKKMIKEIVDILLTKEKVQEELRNKHIFIHLTRMNGWRQIAYTIYTPPVKGRNLKVV